jgi:hypothetical protein
VLAEVLIGAALAVAEVLSDWFWVCEELDDVGAAG